jgi:hypothetical protein
MSVKLRNRILNLPLLLVSSYLLLSLILFVFSPMFPYANYGVLATLYGLAAVGCFAIGYMFCVRHFEGRPARLELGTSKLDALIVAMSALTIIFYVPQIQMAFSHTGAVGILDVFSDIGQNYLRKDALIEELGDEALGPFYTIVNLISFTQVAVFVLPLFRWKDIGITARLAYFAALITQFYFFVTIGTMSGIFYAMMLSFSGWLAGRYLGSLSTPEATRLAVKKISRMLIACVVAGLVFFLFMVFTLSSRSSRITVDLPGFYEQDSIVYRVFGPEIGDGFGLALAYITNGWYGLSNSFNVDFVWTKGLSSSRVFTSYYYRFAGIVSEPIPLSYPVRQENITGYPPFAYWHTVFPWLASDFTFPGALILTALFAMCYAKIWINTIREGCLISATLFGLLSLAAFFMNANLQVLDNKQLTLALVGLCLMYPFRRGINAWLLHQPGSVVHVAGRLGRL